ncbi:MAG: AAA family ATPase [Woeseiaceae bacterium]
MYEQQFGLQRRPFLAKASQSDVFVGPQTAQTMAGLRKALQVQDAIVSVTGPAGSGKSTLVGKAIEAIAATHAAVRIGRMSLGSTDMLEFLLEELGATELPRGTIRQFTALREKLHQLEQDGRHVVIVVEDARRLGVETLAELEALTAADAGESGGAAIVAMGDDDLREFLSDPELTRFDQRIRLRHTVLPLSEPELRGYFMHCFRRAGGDFERAFDQQAAGVIRSLSRGIPRMANNIAEASMAAAAAAGTVPVSAELITEIAIREFGLEGPAVEPRPVAESEPVPEPEPAPEPVPAPEPAAKPEAVAEPVPASEPESPPVTRNESQSGALDDSAQDAIDDIPELIQDTLPGLEALGPEVALADDTAASTPEPELVLELELETETEAEAEAEAENSISLAAGQEPVLEPEPDSAGPSIPEWDRDPTLAELRPDLDALEQAMDLVRKESDDGNMPDPDDMPVLQPEPEPAPENEEEIPEITLDHAINERVEDNLIDEPGSVSPSTTQAGSAEPKAVETPELRTPPQDDKKADAELERIASELARAKTLEDVDDKLAETLFGEELSLAAAQVAALVEAEQSANDGELGLVDTDEKPLAQAVGSAVSDGIAHDQPGTEIDLGAATGSHAGLDLSASQRLNTVRALRANGAVPPATAAANNASAAPPPPAEPPAPIEDQITSMTQTLKALDVKPPTSGLTADGDDEEEERKRGFFGRFRRS